MKSVSAMCSLQGFLASGPGSRCSVPVTLQVASSQKPAAVQPQQVVLRICAESARAGRLRTEGSMPVPAGRAMRGPHTGATTTMIA